jgi:hypothetical protein
MAPASDNAIGKIEARLDGHDREFVEIRDRQKEDRNDVRGLRSLIIATLAAVCGGSVATLIAILTKKTGLS